MVAVGVALVGCSTRTVSYDEAVAIDAPTFASTPSRPEQSPQLDALVLRDTAGLENSEPDANPALVGQALADLTEAFPDVERISDLYFDDANVWMTIIDPQSPSRSRSVYWSDGSGLSVGEPEFMEEDTTFALSAVNLDAITALVNGLAERYPTLQIDMPRLDTQLSYELGLSWRMELVDARGGLAIIFTDLDGTVTVVDQDQSGDAHGSSPAGRRPRAGPRPPPAPGVAARRSSRRALRTAAGRAREHHLGRHGVARRAAVGHDRLRPGRRSGP